MKPGFRHFALTLAGAVLLAGCGGDKPADQPAAPPAPPAAKSGHAHKAPHGGALVEIGDHFAHVEVVLDDTTGKLTAYALDGHADEPVRLKHDALEIAIKPRQDSPTTPPLTVRLAAVANKLTGETVGDTSQFEGIVPQLKGAGTFDASIRKIEIRGKTFEALDFNFPRGNEHE